MASSITILYHDEANSNWVKLLNRADNSNYNSSNDISTSNKPYAYVGGSPVLTCSITDTLGIPMEMELQLNNRQGSPTMTFVEPVEGQTFIDDPLVNNQIGQFNGLLGELTFLYVYETTTYMPLFQGRIHLLEEKIQGFHGSHILLTCRDALEDLAQGNLSHLQRNNSDLVSRLMRDELKLSTTSTDVGTQQDSSGDDANIYRVGKRSYIVRDLIDKAVYAGGTAQAALATDDVNKFKAVDSRTFVAKDVVDNNRWKYSEHVNGNPLALLQHIAKTDNYTISNKIHYGFAFYADITRLSSLRSVGRRAQDLAYFKSGYEPTTNPTTYGLTVEYAAQNAVNEFPYSNTSIFGTEVSVQKRNMFTDFDFGELANEIWTHVTLKHKGKEDFYSEITPYMYDLDKGETDDISTTNAVAKETRQAITVRTDQFTILYVDNAGEGSGDFTGDTWSYENDSRSRSFQTVSSLHNHPTLRNFSGSSKTHLGNVQFASGTGDNQFLILSHPQEDTLEALQTSIEAGNAPLVYENSRRAGVDTCSATATAYPAAKHRMRKVKELESIDGFIDNYQSLREYIASVLGRANKPGDILKKGYFRIANWPSVKWVNTAQSGSSGSTLVPAGMGGGGSLTPMSYGIKGGAVVTTEDSGYTYVGNISVAASANVSVSMFREDKLDLSDTDAIAGGFRKSWSSGDPYTIYVPTRVGHIIRVTNKLVNVNGEHLVTKIAYNFSMGHVESIIETVAVNNDFNFAQAAALGTKKGTEGFSLNNGLEKNIADLMTAAKAYQATGMLWWHSHAHGATPALAAATKRDYNTFSWSGGQIVTHVDNHPWIINPGDTDAALTTAGYTSPMEANIQYVVYLDRSRDPVDGKYNFEIDQVTHDDNGYVRLDHFVEVAYMTIGKNEPAGKKTFGIPGSSYYSVNIPFDGSSGNGMGMVNVEFLHTFDNVLGTNKLMLEADRVINNEGLTSALMKKGAGRPWTSTLDVQGTAYNAIEWDNGADDTNALLTFGNGDQITLVAGAAASLAAGTHYLYIDGSTEGLTGSITPTTTDSHATSIGDNKLLLALVTVGLSSEGSSPVIMPFNSKVLTINATAITADAITATHVQTGTLGVNKLTSAAQGDISEKTITTVSNSAPGSPRTGDIWFDTSGAITVIKVYDGSNWVIRNNNAPEGGGATVFSSARAVIPTTANSGPNVPNVAVAQYDMWLTTDTNQVYMAQHATNNAAIASGQWTLKDDADAINQGTTTIEGGLIRTNRIKLLRGSGGTDPTAQNYQNSFESTIISGTNTNRLLTAGINASDTTLPIDAYASGDLRIYAGDIILLGSEKMYVVGGSDTSLTVIRGWYTNTAASHNDNAAIYKLNYAVDGYTNPHIIMDAYGITGYSNEFTPEFTLSAETGKGLFGGGVCSLASDGLHLGGTVGDAAANTAINYKFGGGDDGWIQSWSDYNSGRRALFFRSINNSSTTQTDPLVNYLSPHSPGTLSLGQSSWYWGHVYARFHQLRVESSEPSDALVSNSASWGTMYIRGTSVYVKINGTEYGMGGVALGDTPTWTGKHKWTFSSTSQAAIWSSASPGQFDNGLWFKNESAPGTPGSGYIRLYSLSGVLKYKQDDGTIITLDGSGGGVALSDNNTWTGTNIFNGGWTTFNGAVNVDGSSNYLAIDSGAWLSCSGGQPPQFEDGMYLKERTEPATNSISSTWGMIYIKEAGLANKPYYKDDNNTEYDLTSVSFPLEAPNGSGSLPQYTFASDPDTGMYRWGINTIGFASNSTLRLILGHPTSGTLLYNNLSIIGSLTKVSGTFKIPHPLDEENKTLVHGFVESPRYDLIYRGTVTLSNGTATASIDEASNNMTMGTFVALTKNPQVWVQNETGWGAVRGKVETNDIVVTAEDDTSSDTVSWLIVAERNDTYINSEREPWTDENGSFIPEWDNSDIFDPLLEGGE